jgi:CRISPR-associated protein Cas1
MPTLYVTEQGAKICKTSKRLVIRKEKEVLFEIPEFKIEQVLIFGNVQITTQALSFLLEKSIPVSFFNIHGRLKGKLLPIESKNIPLRLMQYEKFKDDCFKIVFSQCIVQGKIKNQKALLQRFSRNHPEVDLSSPAQELSLLFKTLEKKRGLSSIRGVEGRASAIYFKAFSRMIREGFSFKERVKHPPKDPVNALLSLGYTLLVNECFSVLSAIGFDPYLGYFHGPEYGRASLALDLAEEFRQPIVDALTLSLLNKQVFKEEDFEQKEEGVFLKKEARKKYFIFYEKKMLQGILGINYRKLLLQQAQKLAKTLKEGTTYEPFCMK